MKKIALVLLLLRCEFSGVERHNAKVCSMMICMSLSRLCLF